LAELHASCEEPEAIEKEGLIFMRRRVAFLAPASALLFALVMAGAASAYFHPSNLGAQTENFFLVPTYKACSAPTNSHGGPLTFPSCAPPALNGTHVVSGTDTISKGQGKITLKVRCTDGQTIPCGGVAGDQEDVGITTNSSDIRCATNTAVVGHCGSANTNGTNDYDGQVVGAATIRITDSFNGPTGTTTGGTTPATVADIPFSVGVQCAATAGDATIGGNCNAATSADAVLPGSGGAVKEGKKSVVQTQQVQVFDTGTDGVGTPNPLPGAGACPPACVTGAGDELSFETGLYIP
jgi:hypothetical protein